MAEPTTRPDLGEIERTFSIDTMTMADWLVYTRDLEDRLAYLERLAQAVCDDAAEHLDDGFIDCYLVGADPIEALRGVLEKREGEG